MDFHGLMGASLSIWCGDAAGPFRPYGGSLLSWQKEPKPLAPAYGPTLRSGSPRSGTLRGHAAYDLLRQVYVSRLRLRRRCYALPLLVPPLSLLKSQTAAHELARMKIKSSAKRSIALFCGGWSCQRCRYCTTPDTASIPSVARPAPTIHQRACPRWCPTVHCKACVRR